MIMLMTKQHDQRGEINILLIPLILVTLLFIAVGGFAYWAYNGRQHFKNDVDTIVTDNVNANTQKVQAADAAKYAEAAKNPFATYVGPEAYGAVHVVYPKTWSAYVDTSNQSNPVNGYFYPAVVPSINDPESSFALRVQVVPTSYDSVVGQFKGQLQQGTVTVTPYALPKVPDTVGVRIDGQITPTKRGSMIVLPVRDKTLKIWTEASPFTADFNNNILPNFSFSP